MVGVWLGCINVVPTTVRESATPDSKEKNSLTQAVVFSRRHFLCGALLWNCSSAEHEGLSTHVQRECPAEPFKRSILSLRIFPSLPGSCLRFFIAMQIQSSWAHLCTVVGSMRRALCSKCSSGERESL